MKKKKIKLFKDIEVFSILQNQDKRGYLTKFFSDNISNHIKKILKKKFTISEILISSSKKSVLRGMHFQKKPFSYDKIVFLIEGTITDVLLDLRDNSKTFGKSMKIVLDSRKKNLIFLPSGIAHGFYVKSNKALVGYLLNKPYKKSLDAGVKFDSFNFKWNIKKKIISFRDLKLPDFNFNKKY
jgi:dTDP-4-dehydrorhamnose 3,5-epimerase